MTKEGLKKLIVYRDEDDDGRADEDSENALPLVFLHLKFPYNFEPGSESSIKFLDCLKDANNDTFRSRTV